MTKVPPAEYLSQHMPTWDYSDKIKFIEVLEGTLTAFDMPDDYLEGLLYQRWSEWLYGCPTDTVYTRGEYYELALDLLTRVQSIGH